MTKKALGLHQIVDASYRPTSEEIEAVLRFLPTFETPSFEAGKLIVKPGTMPWFRYIKAVEKYEQALYTNGFVFPFNWQAWRRTAARYENNYRLVRNADLQTIRKLLCTHVRAERFSEGHLAAAIESGFVPAVLQRLKKLNDHRQQRSQHMPVSKLRWFESCIELRPSKEWEEIPRHIRGLYVLYKIRRKKIKGGGWQKRYNVAYVGIAFGEKDEGVRKRIKRHCSSKRKGEKWTHFSIFKAWKNVREDELRELEGLLRHIYRKDTHANFLALAKGFDALRKVRVKTLDQLANAETGKDENSHKKK